MIYVIAALAIILFSLLAFGCTTQRQAVKYMNNHAFAAATYCAGSFPVRDSVIYKEGETKTISHTDTIAGKHIDCPPAVVNGKEKIITIKCPPSLIRTDTIYRTDTITSIRENTAQIQALTIQRDKYSGELKQAKNGRNNWRKWALITWAFITVGAAGFIMSKLKII